MKAKAVSALRRKRGLRPVERVAGPQVVGLTPQTTNERRANTMKTYLLRAPKTVEPQNTPAPRAPRARPVATTTAGEGLGRAALRNTATWRGACGHAAGKRERGGRPWPGWTWTRAGTEAAGGWNERVASDR